MPENYSFVKQRDMPSSLKNRRLKRPKKFKVTPKGREDDKLGMKVANIEKRLRKPSSKKKKPSKKPSHKMPHKKRTKKLSHKKKPKSKSK